MITTKEAVERLCEELSKDKEFFLSWQSNIAIIFYDEFVKNYPNSPLGELSNVHKIANESAIKFLNLLINE